MNKFWNQVFIFTAMLVVLIITAEAGCHILNIPKISHHNIKSKSLNLMPKIDSNTLLLIGDSRVEWGVKPEVLHSSIGNCEVDQVINMALPVSNGLDVLDYLKRNQIFPKMVLLGYTPNYASYRSHSLELLEYGLIERISEDINYFLMQNSFLYDIQSVVLFLKGIHPYFKSHKYDEYGGASVTEYGYYRQRVKHQLGGYARRLSNFNVNKLIEYQTKIREFKRFFIQHGTRFYGIYVPVSIDLFSLEEENYNSENVNNMFEKFYDYSDITHSVNEVCIDSLFFYDGSHLSPEFSVEFSTLLGEQLRVSICGG